MSAFLQQEIYTATAVEKESKNAKKNYFFMSTFLKKQ